LRSIVMAKRTLLAVFPHPDDEAYSIGGTLTKYAAEGHEVYLVTATRGEAGEISNPSLATKANLPQVREKELRCACEIYGIHPPRFLDYQDGQLAVVHQGQAVGKLVRIIRELRPEVMITYGPEGIYGHYDHIAVHRWVTIAFDLAADASCFPDPVSDTCSPHQVSRLYYTVLSEEVVRMMSPQGKPAAVMMDGVPFPFVGYRRDQLSAIIDVGPHVRTKLQGLTCHATQFDASSAAEEDALWLESPLFREETFVLGRSTVGVPEGVETDLLRGLP
jgi:N-acetyl-1-D-myo-inositol-2-amino-2-deoxy-alpha-D-glucopyranoside deacetylase